MIDSQHYVRFAASLDGGGLAGPGSWLALDLNDDVCVVTVDPCGRASDRHAIRLAKLTPGTCLASLRRWLEGQLEAFEVLSYLALGVTLENGGFGGHDDCWNDGMFELAAVGFGGRLQAAYRTGDVLTNARPLLPTIHLEGGHEPNATARDRANSRRWRGATRGACRRVEPKHCPTPRRVRRMAQ